MAIRPYDVPSARIPIRVDGDLTRVYSGFAFPEHLVITDFSDGVQLGRFFQRAAQGGSKLLARIARVHAGLSSYSDYVSFPLEPAKSVIGHGPVRLIRDYSAGEFQRMLWELEGGDRPGGRGDHVGNYEGMYSMND